MKQLSLLRNYLKMNNLDGIIIPSTDPHFSEYIAPYYKCCHYISGFTGTVSTVVVTKTSAAIWVDSRYYIQAEQECKENGYEVQKIGLPKTPSIAQWVKKNTSKNSKTAIDGKLSSTIAFSVLEKEFSENSLQLTISNDPFENIWTNREPRPAFPIKIMATTISGENTLSKLARVRDILKIEDSKTHYIVAALDDIAWLLNIRGSDISFNPVTIAYAIVSKQSVKLFLDNNKVSVQNLPYFKENNIDIVPYNSFGDYIKTLKNQTVIYTPTKTDIFHYNLMIENNITLQEDISLSGTITSMKSIKNKTEIKGFEKAMLEEGVALVRFYYWLHTELKSNKKLDEYILGKKIHEYRSMSKLFVQDSFAPIVGMGENGALPHYSAKEIGSKIIAENNFLLIDTGGQYLCGTTDITRTIPLSPPNDQQKLDYTLVLQGMINLTLLVFPINTRGAQLDIAARKYLLKEGLNYKHGTGHGIGHYLNVHEGPQSIRAESNLEVIKAGMVMSNEPAIYRPTQYGIRIENVMVCEKHISNEFGEFLNFRTITLFPIDTTAIDIDRLSNIQRKWINKYHERVYDTLFTHLTSDEQMWLSQRTKAI